VSALSAERLSARYPGQSASAPALVDVDISLEPGDRLLLVGPNGAGKSTFIRIFAGLMRADNGRAMIGAKPARTARQMVGVVTAAENLRLYAELYDVRQPIARALQLLDEVGLAQRASTLVGRLSRGQQQRVAIARALLHDPPVLLLDEPDTGLDLAAFALLETLASDHHRTVVLTTHNLASGLRIGTRVGVLSRGRLVHQQAAVSPADAPALAAMLERLARE
jgi:ABC-type multidrug transport system ATPase subunit